MAKKSNPWVGYLQRSYQDIKTGVLQRLGESNPEVTDHSDSNILVVVIGIFSGLIEMLNYYIDNMARESFITTARKYSSMVKLSRIVDYRIKAIIPASVDVKVSYFDINGNPLPISGGQLIPVGTKFSTANGVEFVTISNYITTAGETFSIIPIRQKTRVDNMMLGQTTNEVDQVFPLGKDYVHNSIELTVGDEPWLRQDTLGRSTPTDKHYIVDVSASKEAYIRFGDGINGAVPEANQEVVGDYFTSLGSLGNVDIGTIITSEYLFNYSTTTIITNPFKAVAGTDYEDIERLRRSVPLSLRTLDRAVTTQDYIDTALLAPGVDKVNLLFNCGKYVNLYISPNNGGVASTSLLQDVEQYFEDKKMVTTFVKALAAGESRLVINLHVVGRFRVNGDQLLQEVRTALLDAYSYEKSDVNKTTRLSDLISLVDNLPRVDYLKVNYLSIIPAINPQSHNVPLNANMIVNPGSTQPINWLVIFDGYYMKIFKNNTEQVNLEIGDTWSDPDNVITITINPGAYIIGMEWKFRTMPVNADLVLYDYSVPILLPENLIVTVQEQLSI